MALQLDAIEVSGAFTPETQFPSSLIDLELVLEQEDELE